jgi:hypothetical protein
MEIRKRFIRFVINENNKGRIKAVNKMTKVYEVKLQAPGIAQKFNTWADLRTYIKDNNLEMPDRKDVSYVDEQYLRDDEPYIKARAGQFEYDMPGHNFKMVMPLMKLKYDNTQKTIIQRPQAEFNTMWNKYMTSKNNRMQAIEQKKDEITSAKQVLDNTSSTLTQKLNATLTILKNKNII